jgi:exonuclease III
MSSSAKWNQTLKICGITKLRSDLIFLSDVRISNKNLVSKENDLKNLFLNNPYEKYNAYFNSTQNKRGVGILIKNNLQAQILDISSSEDENLIQIRATIRGSEVCLICIYGPNNNDLQFFENLANYIRLAGNIPVIIGGDWNCTVSADPAPDNPDCLNMARAPNLLHSVKLNEICDEYELVDPFRLLYPDLHEFTYVPRSGIAANKSRIDFFIISESIIDALSDCTVSVALQNKLFDHKAVTMSFNEKLTSKFSLPTISNKDLQDDLLDFLVKTSVAETYITNSSDNIIGGLNKNFLLNTCGTIRRLIRDCGPPAELRIGLSLDQDQINQRERIRNRIQVLANTLRMQELERVNLDPDPDIFMETLLNNLKTDTISHQSFMRKVKKNKISDLTGTLTNLKKNFLENTLQIKEIESELNTIMDIEMRSELERFRHYDILHNEKMTPKFLALSKIRKNSSTAIIRKADGSAFATETERDGHIRDFYRSIYSPPQRQGDLSVSAVEDFLGPEICANDVVIRSKLTLEESIHFDRPFTIQELDNAAHKLNEKSAGGLDGIGSKFIKKFWVYLRVPLLSYSNFCFEKGSLSQSFNSAGIKLIPKKGDITQIKNWRPISLLNCIFKVIAKAVDNRLSSLNEIILSRAQKGFTKKRQIQECIINIVETISYSENNKIPAFILALDMAKAFDTVRHDFMNNVYKFFGIGPNLIKILNTVSTGRTAALIRDDGSTSQPFPLGTGFPQGSPPSPNQFNICEQIVLFKFELDTRITKIKSIERLPVAREILPVREYGVREYGDREANNETGKVEAFADDTTPTGELNPVAIEFIKEALGQFADISGLKCNVDKSQIMLTGFEGPVPDYVLQSGFMVSDKLKILGFEITKNFRDLESNFQGALQKIRSLVTFWSRFRLSLSGRINVAKTLMLSQISYHGSIIQMSVDTVSEFNEIINAFIHGKLKIAKNLTAAPIRKGGLGFIDLKNFIYSLQCSWIKRSINSSIDVWRQEINLITGDTPSIMSPDIVPLDNNPLLYGFAIAFNEFKRCYLSRNDNFLTSKIWGNPNVLIDRRTKIPVSNNFWVDSLALGPDPVPPPPALPVPAPMLNLHQIPVNLKNLVIADFLNIEGNFKPRLELNALLDREIDRERYELLKKTITGSISVNNRSRIDTGTADPASIDLFMSRFKKGSRPFRKIFEQYNSRKLKCNSLTKTKTFFRLIGCDIFEEKMLEEFNSEWGANYYPPKIKDFIFKFRNNLLGINTRVAHFNANIDRSCTFCRITNQNILHEETFVHLFFECSVTKKVLNSFVRKFLFDNLTTDDKYKKFVFTGMNGETDNIDNRLLRALSVHFNFYIWECKLQKKQPVAESLYNDIFFYIENMRKANHTMQEAFNIDLHICRIWAAEASRRR